MDFLCKLLCEEVYYGITSTDSGKTKKMTLRQAEEYFGKEEFKEILAGYLPNIVAVKLEESAAGGAVGAGSIAGFRGSFFGNGREQDLRKGINKKLKRLGFRYIKEQQESTFDTAGVISKLSAAEKSSDVNRDTVAFGLEDDEGNVVKVYVREEQAEDFEAALANALQNDATSQPEIAEILFDLREKFDIVDVVWPQIPEDEEQEATVPGGGKEGKGEELGTEEPGTGGELDTELGGAEEPGEGEMVAGELEGEGTGEEDIKSSLQAVIDMLKADAEARKAEADAKKAEAQAREAEIANRTAENKIRAEEETLDMEDFYDKKSTTDKEVKRLSQLAKYRHDLAKEAQGKLGEGVESKKTKKRKKKDKRNATTGVPEYRMQNVDPTTGMPVNQELSFQGYLKYAMVGQD